MRRVGVALALLAGCLAILVGLLVRRALESANFETTVRHQMVADRSFDEMERALSRFLEREESRPFGDYRFYLDGAGPDGGGAFHRSPLSRDPDRPFVLGYFQIDPDGSLHTPLRPRDPDLAHRRGDWSFAPEITQLEETLREAWHRALRAQPQPATATVTLEAALPEAEAKSEAPTQERPSASADLELAQRAEEHDLSSQSAYDVVRMLNRGQGLRAERKRKVVEEPLSKVYAQTAPSEGGKDASFAYDSDSTSGSQPPPPSAAPRRAGYSEALTETQLPEAAEGPALASPERPRPARARETRPAVDEVGLSDKEQNNQKKGKRDDGLEDEGETTVRVTLDPMLGRAGSPGQLLLYRTVVVGEQGYRQGLLLDWHQLGQWLQEEVLQSSGLAQVARASFFGPDGASGAPPWPAGELETDPTTARSRGDGYVFAHRFGEPFDALSVELALQPLPDVGSTTPVYLLAGLLALVAAAGLAAIYRMVAVVVQFAERRSNFVAAVSHELKTPLTSIRMYGEMLRDGLVASEAKRDDYYRTITDESERLSRLINNVLEFSRLEKGKRELQLTRGSLAALLEEAVEQLRPHAEREGFRLELALDERLPPLRFDRDAIIQVLFNLVDNSIKYARNAESKDIRLECRRLEDRVCLRLRDYGPGVPQRHLSRVFEAFYRGEDELTRTTKGTGIGLALVKELVESMGASIRATNLDAAEGGGFAVYIEFPPA